MVISDAARRFPEIQRRLSASVNAVALSPAWVHFLVSLMAK